ncbi:hypothetical protein TRICI_001917 [Trichomonascus ciferrii]|uniref:F-box domain-containing protein n=1 Tax=Trichomonascus ciferrii TaxID=44093 RepID=A0A642V810_9ASCO|nr:hypothetical protein TRICI_001917 [Trichomonascus ciferrii]
MDRLPPELIQNIANYLPLQDVVCWRSANKLLDIRLRPFAWQKVSVVSDYYAKDYPIAPFNPDTCRKKPYDFWAEHSCSKFHLLVHYSDICENEVVLQYFLDRIHYCTSLTVLDEEESEICWLLERISQNTPNLKNLEVVLSDSTESLVTTLATGFSHVEVLKLDLRVQSEHLPNVESNQLFDQKMLNLRIRFDEEFAEAVLEWLLNIPKSSLRSLTLEPTNMWRNNVVITAPGMVQLLGTIPCLNSLHLHIPVFNPTRLQWIPSTVTGELTLKLPCRHLTINTPRTRFIGPPISPETLTNITTLEHECAAQYVKFIAPNSYSANICYDELSWPNIQRLSVKTDEQCLPSLLSNKFEGVTVLDFTTNTQTAPDIIDFMFLLRKFQPTLQSVALRCSAYARFDSVEGIVELCETFSPQQYPQLRFLYFSFIRDCENNCNTLSEALSQIHQNYTHDLLIYMAVPGIGPVVNSPPNAFKRDDYIMDHLGFTYPINFPTVQIPASSNNIAAHAITNLIIPKNNPQENFMSIVY